MKSNLKIKKQFNKLLFIMTETFFTINNKIITFAEFKWNNDVSKTKNYMANQFLAAILTFLQKCSFILFAFGIGMMIYSIKDEDGAKRTGAIKLIGIGLLLLSLKKVAEIGGLI